MGPETARALGAINREFYRRNAAEFSHTRDHPWPGWHPILARCRGRSPEVLDVGCGNGRFAKTLSDAGIDVRGYTGLDLSEVLLAEAAARAEAAGIPERRLRFFDLVADPLSGLPNGPFDLITAFGLLHHIPGCERRLELLESLASRLAPAGILALAVWDFASRTRFESRLVSREDYPEGIATRELDAGDHLLRWGEHDFRYCHQVSVDEREDWIRRLGPTLVTRYRSDGKEGDLNEYLIFEAAS